MENFQATLDPQRVSAKAVSALSQADKEALIAHQQAYIPLSGELVEKLRQAKKESENGK